MEGEEPEEIERIVLKKNDVFIYKIPPRPPGGHRAEGWQECMWRGKLQIVAKGSGCSVKFLDANAGTLFAVCPVPKDQAAAIDKCVDSSRYFAVRLDAGDGRHAFVGMGFDNRSDAFDFSCALTDFARRSELEERENSQSPEELHPAVDYSLKEGELIHVDLSRVKKTHERSAVEFADPVIPPPPPPPASATAGRRKSSKPLHATAAAAKPAAAAAAPPNQDLLDSGSTTGPV
eukprot:GHVU01134352.1.p1 GENE.GHVU01134352.1~~GHVU01134352.1.p1  ORF type:complete len:233 (-),score=48.42 GHVU01134352.1:359-1057(-)